MDIFHKVGVTYWKILSQIFTEYVSMKNIHLHYYETVHIKLIRKFYSKHALHISAINYESTYPSYIETASEVYERKLPKRDNSA